MKNYSLYIVLICCCFFGEVKSQVNLVPNPSFEIFTNCPTAGQLSYVPPWYSPTQGTPDYYNACDGIGIFTSGVPLNICGYQYARTGAAYAGFYFYGVTGTGAVETKEYLQIQLTDSLVAHQKYCISFYVNLAIPPSGSFVYNFVAITEIGMYISNDTVSLNSEYTLPYTPQIKSPSGLYLNDTTNWVEISGQYVAHGGEKYITIGNFNIHTDTIGVENHSSNVSSAYYYIDDVSIIDCTNQGIEELTTSNEITLFPNPATSNLTLEIKDNANNNLPANIIITDVLGETVYKQSAPINNQSTINISQLSKGIYFLEVQTEKGITRKKFAKQ